VVTDAQFLRGTCEKLARQPMTNRSPTSINETISSILGEGEGTFLITYWKVFNI